MKIKIKTVAAALLLSVAVICSVSCTSVTVGLPDDETAADSAAATGNEKKNKTPPSFTVIIDPGHGFGDPGSHPEYIYCDEADITVKTATLLKDRLNEAGIKTVLTHDGEKFPSVQDIISSARKYNVEYDEEKMKDNDIFSAYERVIYANTLAKTLGNCFFVSLHTNSVEDSPSTCGLAIDYYENSPYRSALDLFCSSFKDKVAETLGKKTVIFADEAKYSYVVNQYCIAPSVLIEMGYGSNMQDGSDLMNEIWLESFCDMLAKCIAENKELLQKKSDENVNIP